MIPSGWNQIGGYTGITLVLENWGLGVKMGGEGAMRSKPVFDPRSNHPRGLSFLPDPDGIVGMVTLFQLRGVGIPG